MSKYKVLISNLDTSTLEVLTNDEMINLFQKYKNGDVYAKEKLVNGNLKLVLSILKNYTNKTDNLDDLFQVGCIGLIKAIDNFNLEFDVKFSTYAVPMILGEVKRYIRDTGPLRISRSIKDTAYKVLKTMEYLTNKLGYEVSIREASEYLNIPEYEASLALDSLKEVTSMSEPIYSDGGDTIYLEDQISSPKEIYGIDFKITFNEAIKKIKDKERFVLLERYIIGKTQTELANTLGISQAQVSRLEKNAIASIKKLVK